jgi:hypothetical protein
VAGAGFAAALGVAAGDWAKVFVEKILANSTKSEKKIICFILLVIEFGKILLLAMIDYLMCGSIMEQSGFIDDNSEW